MSDVQFVDDCRCFVPCELYVSKILDIGLLLEQESRIKGLTFDNSFKTSAKGV
jgi:hypothetical protein